jgi:hypothetical protein
MLSTAKLRETTMKFRDIDPLGMSLIRAQVYPFGESDYIKLYDDTGDNFVLNIVEARALRDWLTAALPSETVSKQPSQYAAHSPECFLRRFNEGFCDCGIEDTENRGGK